jgi:hypothetical protein
VDLYTGYSSAGCSPAAPASASPASNQDRAGEKQVCRHRFCIAKNEAGAAASRSSINELTMLAPSNDPYRLDTTFGHELSK